MDAALVAQVRSFNRTVTERAGALSDGFLGSGRPLAEARLLWEIGQTDGRELRALRADLGLDSGYLSRLLGALTDAGLVTVRPGEADRRVRVACLTDAGRAEVSVLDKRSDTLAAELLAALAPEQRVRLTSAMREVERLMTAAAVEIRVVDPEHPDAVACLRRYFAELDRRAEEGLDPDTGTLPVDPGDVRPPAGAMLVAYLHDLPVGCGALKLHDAEPCEIKRLWVAETARGLGLGRRLLADLEARATAAGAPAARLDTNRALTEAIALYRSTGYAEVPPFNDEPFSDYWFEKALP